MASLALTTTLPKVRRAGSVFVRSPWSSRVFVHCTPRYCQATARDEDSTAADKFTEVVKQGVNIAGKQGAQEMKDKAASAAEDMTQKTKEVAGKVSETVQDITEKAKQTVQGAWGSVKETVAGKTEEAKECVKENVECVKENVEDVKRNMNTKN